MSGSTRSGRDQVTYKTYDDRAVSRDAIYKALRDLEVRQRRRERLARMRAWTLMLVAALILLAACAALIWWRFVTIF